MTPEEAMAAALIEPYSWKEEHETYGIQGHCVACGEDSVWSKEMDPQEVIDRLAERGYRLTEIEGLPTA